VAGGAPAMGAVLRGRKKREKKFKKKYFKETKKRIKIIF
jgi:hypothetical protein